MTIQKRNQESFPYGCDVTTVEVTEARPPAGMSEEEFAFYPGASGKRIYRARAGPPHLACAGSPAHRKLRGSATINGQNCKG